MTAVGIKQNSSDDNNKLTVRPSVASRLIRGFELFNTLLHKFDSYESEDSAQKRCA